MVPVSTVFCLGYHHSRMAEESVPWWWLWLRPGLREGRDRVVLWEFSAPQAGRMPIAALTEEQGETLKL
jgi:hypothetical protein